LSFELLPLIEGVTDPEHFKELLAESASPGGRLSDPDFPPTAAPRL